MHTSFEIIFTHVLIFVPQKKGKNKTNRFPIYRGDSRTTEYRSKKDAIRRAKGCDSLQSFDFTRVPVKCHTKSSKSFYSPFLMQSKRPAEGTVIPSDDPVDERSNVDEAKASQPSIKTEAMEENLNIGLTVPRSQTRKVG